ncbi:unnamed protein product, partial [Amoebophrya sp. A25]
KLLYTEDLTLFNVVLYTICIHSELAGAERYPNQAYNFFGSPSVVLLASKSYLEHHA